MPMTNITQPHRVQLSRKKGWRMPANTVKVDRTTPFGNKFRNDDDPSPYVSIREFEKWLRSPKGEGRKLGLRVRKELPGKNLACWCALDGPCHADVLLEFANAEHPFERLDSVFDRESKKRNTFPGLIRAARDGERTAVREFAQWAHACVSTAGSLPDVRDQLLTMLEMLMAGDEPNKVFGWKRAGKGNPGLAGDRFRMLEALSVGNHVDGVIATSNISPSKAQQVVAIERKLTVSFVRDCWLKCKGQLPL